MYDEDLNFVLIISYYDFYRKNFNKRKRYTDTSNLIEICM